jgi:mycothiol synthase
LPVVNFEGVLVNKPEVNDLKITSYTDALRLSSCEPLNELAGLRSKVFPGISTRADQFTEQLRRTLDAGGCLWIAELGERLIGYAWIAPVPGLSEIWEVAGGVDPAYQRQGLGSVFLNRLLAEWTATPNTLLTHAVDSLETGAARFLRSQGFFVEHEEWTLIKDDLSDNQPQLLPDGCRIRTLPKKKAVERFCRLYDLCFSGLPWYQPYPDQLSVAAELAGADDLVFVELHGKPTGFQWLRWPEIGLGEIEPIGIVPEHRNKGLGKLLLRDAIYRFTQHGARQVRLGVWRNNYPAINLYEGLGFRYRTSLYYLAYRFQ